MIYIFVLGQPDPIYTTPKNDYLEAHQPHVVMALMEGLGNNVLVEDDPENNDLLGSLRKHFDESLTKDCLSWILYRGNGENKCKKWNPAIK